VANCTLSVIRNNWLDHQNGFSLVFNIASSAGEIMQFFFLSQGGTFLFLWLVQDSAPQ
jgi:hypothetical protein